MQQFEGTKELSEQDAMLFAVVSLIRIKPELNVQAEGSCH